MRYSVSIYLNDSFSTFLLPILLALFAIALPGCDSPANGLEEQGEISETAPVNVVTAESLVYKIVITDLGTLSGEGYSTAEDINDKEQVVGHDNYDAILWEGDSRTELGNLGSDRTDPQAINEKGQVVGYGRTANDVEHAFL